MIETKTFEVRDTGTFIPCIAICIQPYDHAKESQDYYLMRRAGYGAGPSDGLILFGRLEGGEFHYDMHAWGRNRTMAVAHKFITDNWDTLDSGVVIDVGYILDLQQEPKQSERFETGIEI